MFGLKLDLPEHVTVTVDPHPDDPKSMMLVVKAKMAPSDEPLVVQKKIPRGIGAVEFGSDLKAAVNYLYGQLAQR